MRTVRPYKVKDELRPQLVRVPRLESERVITLIALDEMLGEISHALARELAEAEYEYAHSLNETQELFDLRTLSGAVAAAWVLSAHLARLRDEETRIIT